MDARLASRQFPIRSDWSWIGRAGCAFFRKSFVVRSLRALALIHRLQ
jgi:hypothetical protein